ncbi:hypothetical protein VG1_CDS0063 [Arthrobacter phage Cupello]|nr:hypothetical protein VG1_CDS0063 [Arthrobacter phage Cupello]
MGVKSCGQCDFNGPELPGGGELREVHRALHGLGRRFLEALDPILSAFVPIKPLENLDFKIPDLPVFNLNECRFLAEVPPVPFPVIPFPVVPDLAVPRGELRVMMGGREVGRATFDGDEIVGEVLDAGAIAQLRADLLGGVSIGEDVLRKPDAGLAGHAACSRGYAGWVADSRRKP